MELSDLLKKEIMTIDDLCDITHLNKQLFERFFGENNNVDLKLYSKETGHIETYRFLKQKTGNETYYINIGYMPPLP